MRFERDIRELEVRYDQDFAYALQAHPLRRRRLIELDGALRYYLSAIRLLFCRERLSFDEAASPPDGKWWSVARVKEEDLWFLMSPPGTGSVTLWGAQFRCSAEAIQQAYSAMESVYRYAFFADESCIDASKSHTKLPPLESSDVVIHCEEFLSDGNTIPLIRLTWTEESEEREWGLPVCGGEFSETLPYEFDQIRILASNTRSQRVIRDTTKAQDKGEVETARRSNAKVRLMLDKFQRGAAIEVSDIEELREAMTYSAGWTTDMLLRGLREPFPFLVESIAETLSVIRAALLGDREIVEAMLWSGVTDDGYPADPRGKAEWDRLFEAVAPGRVVRHSPPSTDSEVRYDLKSLRKNWLGVETTKFAKLRSDAGCEGSPGNRTPMTRPVLEKFLRWIVKHCPEGNPEHEGALKMLAAEFDGISK